MNAYVRGPQGKGPHADDATNVYDESTRNGSGINSTGGPNSPYRTGAPAYAAAEWTGVFPVAPATKHPALKGMTGRGGAQTRPEQYNRPDVVSKYAGHNVGLRLAPSLVGIDVDDYDDKTGGAALAALEARLGALPPTYSSTARGDGPSRIRLYQVPKDCGELAVSAGTDIDVIQHHHRYTVVWPSVHPKTGTVYRWHAPDGILLPEGTVPAPDAFAVLPSAWLEHLSKPQREHAPGAGLAVDEFIERCTEESDPGLSGRIRNHFSQTRSGSRHDTMLWALGEIARCAARGEVNAGKAFERLEEDWAEAMAGESRDTDREFAALLERAVADAPEPGSAAAVETVGTHLPEGFWSSRKTLEHIRRAAHARAVSADAVLYGVLARLASMLPGDLRVDTGMMSPASLNLNVGIVSASGAGKTASQGLAAELVPVPDQLAGPDAYMDNVPIGSGEGLAEAYMGDKRVVTGTNKDGSDRMEKTRTQVRHNALFYVDEGKTLITLMTKREGATLGAVFRTMWTGKTAGQQNGTKERTRRVDNYALGVVVGFQPSTALPVFEGTDEGTPQRFIWTVADDPTIPEDAPGEPGPLWDGPGWLTEILLQATGRDPWARTENLIGDQAQGCVRLADTIKRRLRAEHLARQKGEEKPPALDSHRPLMLVKLSALLALLDGRTDVTEDDWSTAAVLWGASCAVRDGLLNAARRDRERTRAERREDKVQEAVAVHQAKAEADSDTERVARRLWGVINRKDSMARSDLRRDLGRDKKHFTAALSLALARGWLDEEESARGTKIVQGTSQPTP
ncbi:bifunctional DNA primase/polymerase [Streptomyces phaeochromogenes]|uniref:bifunctional DNA primase/polymerase n=1 Tax=Streptomyces phaeochromogenes TaxID=1923 RepID=UPI00371CCBB4